MWVLGSWTHISVIEKYSQMWNYLSGTYQVNICLGNHEPETRCPGDLKENQTGIKNVRASGESEH